VQPIKKLIAKRTPVTEKLNAGKKKKLGGDLVLIHSVDWVLGCGNVKK